VFGRVCTDGTPPFSTSADNSAPLIPAMPSRRAICPPSMSPSRHHRCRYLHPPPDSSYFPPPWGGRSRSGRKGQQAACSDRKGGASRGGKGRQSLPPEQSPPRPLGRRCVQHHRLPGRPPRGRGAAVLRVSAGEGWQPLAGGGARAAPPVAIGAARPLPNAWVVSGRSRLAAEVALPPLPPVHRCCRDARGATAPPPHLWARRGAVGGRVGLEVGGGGARRDHAGELSHDMGTGVAAKAGNGGSGGVGGVRGGGWRRRRWLRQWRQPLVAAAAPVLAVPQPPRSCEPRPAVAALALASGLPYRPPRPRSWGRSAARQPSPHHSSWTRAA